MSDNQDEEETPNEEPKDDQLDHIEEHLESGDKITKAHLDEYKKQLDARMDQLSRDKSHDDTEKSELKGKIESLETTIRELKESMESKSKEGGGETMLIAPEELNPKQQNDGVDDQGPTGDSQPPQQKRSGWKRWV
ncbi:MAG TPA: hypothetical protein VGF75_06215 [Candidatus Saccharimonadales bacterium]|jgi:hypothetical protein